MTKIFAVALAALTIASCSKEEIGGSNNGTNGEELNAPTYATFKFNIGGPSSRGDFNPITKAEDNPADAKIGSLQLLIFNAATQGLEFNESVTVAETGATTKTVLLTAGKKKIFVVANCDNLPYKDLIEPVEKFKVGVNTLAEFYALKFEAGTPQKINPSGDRTFVLSPLHTAVSDKVGLPMSNTNEVTYTLKAGVSEAEAGEEGGTAETNTFSIQLHYMVAKARLILEGKVLSAGDEISKPVIKDVTYSIRNLACVTNYIQNVPTAGNPQSFYYTGAFTDKSLQADFDPEFDYASNISVGATAAAGDYLYVPENNHSMLRRGQSSYFAIKATFQPVVISKVEYNLDTNVKYTYAKLAGAIAEGESTATLDYIYTTNDVHGIPAGTYFLNVALLQKAAWMMKNKVPFPTTEAEKKAAEDEILFATPKTTAPTTDGDYLSFTDGISYYRVDLGQGSGAATQYGVLRSNRYEAKINQITGPGVPSEQDLIIKPHDPVSARTYISATITAAEWTPITQSADL